MSNKQRHCTSSEPVTWGYKPYEFVTIDYINNTQIHLQPEEMKIKYFSKLIIIFFREEIHSAVKHYVFSLS